MQTTVVEVTPRPNRNHARDSRRKAERDLQLKREDDAYKAAVEALPRKRTRNADHDGALWWRGAADHGPRGGTVTHMRREVGKRLGRGPLGVREERRIRNRLRRRGELDSTIYFLRPLAPRAPRPKTVLLLRLITEPGERYVPPSAFKARCIPDLRLELLRHKAACSSKSARPHVVDPGACRATGVPPDHPPLSAAASPPPGVRDHGSPGVKRGRAETPHGGFQGERSFRGVEIQEKSSGRLKGAPRIRGRRRRARLEALLERARRYRRLGPYLRRWWSTGELPWWPGALPYKPGELQWWRPAELPHPDPDLLDELRAEPKIVGPGGRTYHVPPPSEGQDVLAIRGFTRAEHDRATRILRRMRASDPRPQAHLFWGACAHFLATLDEPGFHGHHGGVMRKVAARIAAAREAGPDEPKCSRWLYLWSDFEAGDALIPSGQRSDVVEALQVAMGVVGDPRSAYLLVLEVWAVDGGGTCN